MPYNTNQSGVIDSAERDKRKAAWDSLTDSSLQQASKDWLRKDITGKQLTGSAGDYGPTRALWNGAGFEWNPAYTNSMATNSAASPSPAGGAMQPNSTAVKPAGLLAQPSSLSFSSSTTSGINPVTRTITPDELASTQLDSLLSKDSALSQRAQTSGKQYANTRGLLNSSMGAEAAYGAWVDRATPIAQQDASRYGEVADKNMDAQNMFKLEDKKFSFDLDLQKNEQSWRTGENTKDRSLTSSENTKDRSLTASEGAAGRSSQLALAQMGIAADDRRFDKDVAFRGAESQLDRDFTIGRDTAQNEFTAGENQQTREFDRDTQMQAAEIDAQAQLTQHLYGLEELGYRFNLDQMNMPKTYAANIMGELSTGINAILADPDLDEASKKNAIDNRVAVTNDMLKFGSTVYNTPIPLFGGDPSAVTTNEAPQPGITAGQVVQSVVNT